MFDRSSCEPRMLTDATFRRVAEAMMIALQRGLEPVALQDALTHALAYHQAYNAERDRVRAELEAHGIPQPPLGAPDA